MKKTKTKKVTFESLKVGIKFRYQRKLYIKDAEHCGVNIMTGMILPDGDLLPVTLVTPVKVKIRVL